MGNLAMYGMLGLVKGFTKTKTVGELTKTFRQSLDLSDKNEH